MSLIEILSTLAREDVDLLVDGLLILQPDGEEARNRRDDLLDMLGPLTTAGYAIGDNDKVASVIAARKKP